jgi:hypothetical protein
MKFAFTTLALAAVVTAGCASAPQAPADLTAGRFVTLACADGKSFQARYADDGKTIRVRAHHGSAELERQSDGRFTGDGYILDLKGAGGISLDHAGKSQGKACKRAG